jgi:hypothetical protein
MKIDHTFLFDEGLWETRGEYRDESGVALSAVAMSEIIHRENLWVIESSMTLSGNDGMRLSNTYEVVPFKREDGHTRWKSVNPAVGNLLGRFAVVNDMILSTFVSESDEYSGMEALLFVSSDLYRAGGMFFSGERRLSSWAMELVRKK